MKSRFVLAQMEQKGLPEENLESARKAVAEAMERYQPDLMPVSYTHLRGHGGRYTSLFAGGRGFAGQRLCKEISAFR